MENTDNDSEKYEIKRDRLILSMYAIHEAYRIFLHRLRVSKKMKTISLEEFNRQQRWFLRFVEIFEVKADPLRMTSELGLIQVEVMSQQILDIAKNHKIVEDANLYTIEQLANPISQPFDKDGSLN